MGRLKEEVFRLEKAFERLTQAYLKAQEEKTTELYQFLRDSAIQRFEFTYELLWKCIKFYLFEVHGVVCNSPRLCIGSI